MESNINSDSAGSPPSPPPLPPLEPIPIDPSPLDLTALLKDDNGFSHIFWDGVEIDCYEAFYVLPKGVIQNYERMAAGWKQGEGCAALGRLLEKIVGQGGVVVDRVVGMGLSSFTEPDNGIERLKDSMEQLAVLMWMAEVLGKFSDPPTARLPLFIQDPTFGAMDRRLLTRLSISILEDPAAQNSITPTTLLYTPCVVLDPIYEIFAMGKYPAVFIGHDIESVLCHGRGGKVLDEEIWRRTWQELMDREKEENSDDGGGEVSSKDNGEGDVWMNGRSRGSVRGVEKAYVPFLKGWASEKVVIQESTGEEKVYWRKEKQGD